MRGSLGGRAGAGRSVGPRGSDSFQPRAAAPTVSARNASRKVVVFYGSDVPAVRLSPDATRVVG